MKKHYVYILCRYLPFYPGQVSVDFLHAVAHLVEYVAQRLVHVDDDSQIGGKISLCPIMNSIANCAYDRISFCAKQASFLEQVPWGILQRKGGSKDGSYLGAPFKLFRVWVGGFSGTGS